MSEAAHKLMTEAEYLAMEADSKEKHEYRSGTCWSMAGGTPRHSLLAGNLGGALWSRLKGSRCGTLNSDIRVHIPAKRTYYYPDVTVVCGEPVYSELDRNSVTNPSALFEVLSASTEAFDRAGKFDDYRSIESLQTYVVAHQREPRVTRYERQPSGDWTIHDLAGMDAELQLNALGITIPLAEIYDRYKDYRGDEPVKPGELDADVAERTKGR